MTPDQLVDSLPITNAEMAARLTERGQVEVALATFKAKAIKLAEMVQAMQSTPSPASESTTPPPA